MKKLLGIIIAVSLVIIAGCEIVNINNSELLAMQIAAQRTGYYIAKNNPNIVLQARLVAQGILSTKDEEAVKSGIDMAIKEICKQVPNDPLLESDLKLIVSGLNIKVPDAKIDMKKVEPIVTAFLNGMEIGVKK